MKLNTITGINYIPTTQLQSNLYSYNEPEETNVLDYKIEGYKPQYNITPETQSTSTETQSTSTVESSDQKVKTSQTNTEVKSSSNSPKSNIEVIGRFLAEKLKLTPEQTAGLLTHVIAESGGKHTAINKDEKAGKNPAVKADEYGRGLIQWTGDRAKAFETYIAAHGGQNNQETQLNFMVDEITTKYQNFLNNLRQAKTAEDASDLAYVSYVGGNYKFNEYDPEKVSATAAARSQVYQRSHAAQGYKVRDSRMERRNNAHKYIFEKNGGAVPSRTNLLYNRLKQLQNDSRS